MYGENTKTIAIAIYKVLPYLVIVLYPSTRLLLNFVTVPLRSLAIYLCSPLPLKMHCLVMKYTAQLVWREFDPLLLDLWDGHTFLGSQDHREGHLFLRSQDLRERHPFLGSQYHREGHLFLGSQDLREGHPFLRSQDPLGMDLQANEVYRTRMLHTHLMFFFFQVLSMYNMP